MLIRHAADIDVRNRKGQKPLQVAMSLWGSAEDGDGVR